MHEKNGWTELVKMCGEKMEMMLVIRRSMRAELSMSEIKRNAKILLEKMLG